MKKLITFLCILTIASTTFAGCSGQDTTTSNNPDDSDIDTVIDFIDVEAGTFAEWQEDEISFTPSVENYTVNIPKDDIRSGNVKIDESTYLYPEVIDLLNKNAFAVDTGYGSSDEFFEIYESNRYKKIPNFVTTDSVLHTYHLYFNYLLKSLEEDTLYTVAVDLTNQMLEKSQEQYEELKGSELEDAALRNVAYFAVAQKTLDPNAEIPKEVKDEVEMELTLMKDHEGIKKSGIFGGDNDYMEDYSQYVPRGHYTKSEKLKKYFNALMWYGRLTFRLDEDTETYSALLIIEAIENNPEIYTNWEKLYEPINFFVGEPDDICYYEYRTLTEEIYGIPLTTDALADTQKFTQFKEKAKLLPPPKINSMPILADEQDDTEKIQGFRFMGQRSTIDAMIFQKLVYGNVKENPEGMVRMLPMSLDIPAALGSQDAYEILEELGETQYAGYTTWMTSLQKMIEDMPEEQWGKNLYWGWTNTLRALLNEYGDGYPSFMQNKAWKKKELMTFLASWTELKHDTILYAKQVYAEMGGGPMPSEIDDRGYVEPNPELYNRLRSLINLTIDGLETRDLLAQKDKEQLQKLEELVTILRDISIKELENQTLTDEEYEFIRSYGGSLEHFWYETLSDDEKAQDQETFLNSHPAEIIADVATDPNGYVLEEAIGGINKIWVVFPIDGELHLAEGSVFSHYEFAWPMNDRLTNEKWRYMLHPWEDPDYDWDSEEDTKPEIAKWQREFTYINE